MSKYRQEQVPGRCGAALLRVCLLLSGAGFSACAVEAPPCPVVELAEQAEPAPSAGCFAATAAGLLLVQGMNGHVSVPGGSSLNDETPRCTAFRETWEETGLSLQPRELLTVFDTGFHLYRCAHDVDSGSIDPPPRLEVRTAFYLPVSDFAEYSWRFTYQREIMQQLMAQPR
ncbi:NUDIX domain-containing protein [Halieaceae bacterium IMCC14734]|uniref:NUDIX domain-containing protein n=1 Tax=Candidatus Litorirhabdus singularis TaxID=2518993 RepID=A0ABT3TBF5_9GAMM|nr:NUDIX domain-containing protein [Candidatus Litorirhabdus singularis]MCX2979614.1 NUDIX domain-containing protein [Candidatus Litorirhabdus singularis]